MPPKRPQPDIDSGEDSDQYVWRVYNEMIAKDQNKSSKTKSKGSKTGRKPKRMVQNQEQKSNGAGVSAEEYNDLLEDNRRLRQLLDQYKKESNNIINKAVVLKNHEKTSVMQTLELMKLIGYLKSRLPESEDILEQYVSNSSENESISCQSIGIANNSRANDSQKSHSSKAFKSPVINPISNYFKSADKSDGINRKIGYKSDSSDNECEDKSIVRSKLAKTETKSIPKKHKSSDECDGQRRSIKTSPMSATPLRRVSPRKPTKPNISKESKVNTSEEQRLESSRANSWIGSKSKNKDKQKQKKGSIGNPKKKLKPRIKEPIGLYPCTFDPRQCDEIMDTKEHFDFHMSGHYDAKYVCPFCAYTGPTIQVIQRHMFKERDDAIQEAKNGRYLNADKRAHKTSKTYKCLGCKVCHKIHYKLDKRCEHIIEDEANQCSFMHDSEYEFKDHLKSIHFCDQFTEIEDREERRLKVRAIVHKFVEDGYFENNARKDISVEKSLGLKNEIREEPLSSGSDWD